MSDQQAQQQQDGGLDGVWFDKYESISRIANYGFVNSTYEQGRKWYNLIKEANSLTKKSFEIGESGVLKAVNTVTPQLEKFSDVIKIADNYSCKGLDAAERQVQNIKDTGNTIIAKVDSGCDSALNVTAEYTPNKVLDLAQYTSGQIDSLVEKLLPPTEGEDLNSMSDEEKFQLEKKMKFLLKLRKRISFGSVLSIPSNSIHAFTGYGAQSLNATIAQMNDLIAQVQSLKVSNEFTKQFIESIYSGIDQVVHQVAALSVSLKKIDISEALISLGELSKMIKESKNVVFSTVDSNEKLEIFKSDCSKIMKNILDVVNKQVDSGKDKLDEVKVSIPFLNSSVSLLQNQLEKIIKIIDSYSKSLESASANSSQSKVQESS